MNTEKYLETIQYILGSAANNSKLGKVKLMKLLYFADFDHFLQHGEPITGDLYHKQQFGPVPSKAQVMLNELRRREILSVEYRPLISYMKYSFSLKDPFDPDRTEHLTSEEKRTLSSVIAKWQHHTTEDIVLASHGEPTWQMVDFGQVIPYEYVYYREDVVRNEKDEEPEVIPTPRAS